MVFLTVCFGFVGGIDRGNTNIAVGLVDQDPGSVGKGMAGQAAGQICPVILTVRDEIDRDDQEDDQQNHDGYVGAEKPSTTCC